MLDLALGWRFEKRDGKSYSGSSESEYKRLTKAREILYVECAEK